MANWKDVLTNLVSDVEDHYDLLKYRLRERLGGRDPIQILPYRGYGTQETLYLKGRVLEDKDIQSATESHTLWDNLVNMYKRFNSKEIPYARVLATFDGARQQVVSDIEGFFEVNIEPPEPLPTDRLWHAVNLELLQPVREGSPPVTAEGHVLVPPPDAEFGVISDIDDTVLPTDATHLLNMARTVFLGNARTRLPFKGAAAFYRALMRGRHGRVTNPLFYVSSSPWNIYDLLADFFNIQDIPLGPVLFLRDWGLTEEELLPVKHKRYKTDTIRKILDTYSDLPFILIGDSGQEDPEIYYEVVRTYSDRILAVYIRNVRRRLWRADEIRALAEEVIEAGSTLILADDTYTLAQHAVEKGWISPESLPEIKAEKELDEGPPTPVEKLLGEEEKEEGPTVVIDGESPQETKDAVERGAIEESLDEGDKDSQGPPKVIVDGEEDN